MKRLRERKAHRWSDRETLLLVERVARTVQGNYENYEKPTAVRFYARLFGQTPLAFLGWNVVKNKMRNLRTTYMQAKTWREETANQENAEFINEHMQVMCPYWDLLHSIFSCKPASTEKIIVPKQETLDETSLPENAIVDSLATPTDTKNIDGLTSPKLASPTPDPPPIQSAPFMVYLNHNPFNRQRCKTRNRHASRVLPPTASAAASSAAAAATTAQNASKHKLQQERLALQRHIAREKLMLERERLQFEKEKFAKELEMRRYEIDKNFEIKMLEFNLKQQMQQADDCDDVELEVDEEVIGC